METKKLICVEVCINEIDALEELIMSKINPENIIALKGVLAPLLQSLRVEFDKESITVEILKLIEENEKLSLRIGSLMYHVDAAKELSRYAAANFSAAAADFILNPEPIDLPCTKKGRSLNFKVSLKNILAIESKGRVKRIYLREPAIPKEGGSPYFFIETNSKEFDFNGLLYKLQVNRKHLFRVSKSYAINIFHYEFSDTKMFHMIEKPANNVYEPIAEISTDKVFDLDSYHHQLWVIDYMYKYRDRFALNLKKIEEIRRYMDSLDVTK